MKPIISYLAAIIMAFLCVLVTACVPTTEINLRPQEDVATITARTVVASTPGNEVVATSPASSPNVAVSTANPDDWKVLPPSQPTATPPAEEIDDPAFEQGKTAYRNGDFQEAYRLLSSVIEQDSQLAPPYVYRGAALDYLGRYEEALADLNMTLSILPDYALAHAHRGVVLVHMGDEAGAVQDTERALELDPTLAMAHHNLGAHYMGHGNFVKALEHFTAALSLDPLRRPTWQARGETFAHIGRFEECLDDFNRAINGGAAWASIYSGRGFCKVELGQYESGIEDLSLAYEIDFSRTAMSLYTRGKAYYFLGEFDLALADLDRNIEIYPTHSTLYTYRGLIYLAMGDYEKALSDFDQATFSEIDPNGAYSYSIPEAIALTHYGRGRALFEMGKYNEAVQELTQSLAYDPKVETQPRRTNQQLLLLGPYYRALSYQALGEDDLAISDYDMFLQLEAGQYPDLSAEATTRLAQLQDG